MAFRHGAVISCEQLRVVVLDPGVLQRLGAGESVLGVLLE